MRIRCPHCGWSAEVASEPIRVDQQIMVAATEHLDAAHRLESRELRGISTAERRVMFRTWLEPPVVRV